MANSVGRISQRDRKELTKQARTINRHLRKFTCELVSQLGRCSTTNDVELDLRLIWKGDRRPVCAEHMTKKRQLSTVLGRLSLPRSLTTGAGDRGVANSRPRWSARMRVGRGTWIFLVRTPVQELVRRTASMARQSSCSSSIVWGLGRCMTPVDNF
jgi:hypothetical protein